MSQDIKRKIPQSSQNKAIINGACHHIPVNLRCNIRYKGKKNKNKNSKDDSETGPHDHHAYF